MLYLAFCLQYFLSFYIVLPGIEIMGPRMKNELQCSTTTGIVKDGVSVFISCFRHYALPLARLNIMSGVWSITG